MNEVIALSKNKMASQFVYRPELICGYDNIFPGCYNNTYIYISFFIELNYFKLVTA